MSGRVFDQLRNAHIKALAGGLLEGVESGPDGAGYVWSRTIPDPTLNFAFGVRTASQFAWAGAVALGRGRAPAFLARDAAEAAALRNLFEPAAVFPACWMAARACAGPRLPEPLRLVEHEGPRPRPPSRRCSCVSRRTSACEHTCADTICRRCARRAAGRD
ncbi:hypothetical protein [Methylobacterium gregans]|uniref:hypothetical protein n=1 Tax=Methylobacterium gregans TaxID=374424 RepID=UPI00361C07AB